MKRIFFVAGDPSGDMHAAELARTLKSELPQIEIYSAGGKELAVYTQQFLSLTDIAVTGIWEVLGHLPKITQAFHQTLEKIREIKPDLVILVDFPDFNLRLAKELKKQNFRIIYYISPQVWAWRKERVKLIKKYIDKMLVIFPFEETFYKKEGIDAAYVGHPLAEKLLHLSEIDIYSRFGLEPQKTLISLLPGSRPNEIKRHLKIMLEAKTLLEKKNSSLQFALIKARNLPSYLFSTISDITVIDDFSYQVIKNSTLAITASGTATFELLLLEVPSVVIYRLSWPSYFLLKRLVKTEYISMANILCQEKVFIELIQNQANPFLIARTASSLLADPHKLSRLKLSLQKAKQPFLSLSHFRYTAEKIKAILF